MVTALETVKKPTAAGMDWETEKVQKQSKTYTNTYTNYCRKQNPGLQFKTGSLNFKIGMSDLAKPDKKGTLKSTELSKLTL